MQEYGVLTSLKLIRNIILPQNAIRFGAYILGEYSNKLPTEGEDKDSLEEVVLKLQFHFERSFNPVSQAIVVTSLSKIGASPTTPLELKELIEDFLGKQVTNISEDTQSRAFESLELLKNDPAQAANALATMPAFAYRQSILLKDLKKKVKQSGMIDRGSRHLEGVKDTPDDDDENENDVQDQAALQSGLQAAQLAAQNPQQLQQSQQSSVPQTTESNLIDFNIGFSTPSTTAQVLGAVSNIPVRSPQEENFNNLVKTNEGLLYEDDTVSVTCRHEYQKSEGRMLLTYSSKVVGQVSVRTEFVEVSGLSLNAKPLSKQEITSKGDTIQQQVIISCSSAFFDSPVVNVFFYLLLFKHFFFIFFNFSSLINMD
jgi:AP-2 complex subunit alpha